MKMLSVVTCPECGAEVLGGKETCHDIYHQLTYQALGDIILASVLNLAFDTYCMQHVETFCVSAKSYVAHLTRLCVGIEYDGDQAIYTALQRWYHADLAKPTILTERGNIRITDVHSVREPEAKQAMIREWAINVWTAYASQHHLAHHWINEARAWNRKKGHR